MTGTQRTSSSPAPILFTSLISAGLADICSNKTAVAYSILKETKALICGWEKKKKKMTWRRNSKSEFLKAVDWLPGLEGEVELTQRA